MKHNVQTLSFLIGSFNQMIVTFGENSKTVEFFRTQVNGLVDIGQVSLEDVDLIFSLIGMKNTDSVKWDVAKKKINIFVEVMNKVSSVSDKNVKLYILNEMNLTDEIKGYVKDIYDLNEQPDIKSKVNNTFGSLNRNIERTINNKNEGLWFRLLDIVGDNKRYFATDYYIRVHNKEAVCSCDTMYFYCRLIDLFKEASSESDKVLNMIADNNKYDIVIRKPWNDPCKSGYNYVVDEQLTKLAEKINFTALRMQYFKLK